MSAEEIRMAQKWYIEDEESPKEIAERLGRDKSTITRLLVKRAPRKQRGPKAHVLTNICRAHIQLRVCPRAPPLPSISPLRAFVQWCDCFRPC